MLKTVKIALVATVAAWGLVGALGNFVDWDGTRGAVAAATSMATWEGGASSWKATSNPFVVLAGAVMIPALKLTSAVLCLLGGWAMWRTRDRGYEFEAAKRLALAGCGVAMFLLFAGWIVIAESWFEMWRSEAMRGPVLDSAFRYLGCIALIALFVGLRDDRRSRS
ncbi:DUF2165 domain-containing protein [Tsuneonella sp. YG55]|uniref:DUF2165 domain-containing protein n=1 Tax=Tsuneonella litorea TaxID=2976475 RepID=A0A9X2VYX6_9SPHN|nr:DUF2165 domain-containing protein [Tsuneonella litorea]MCT2557907.1 DUF2165 domain-containing protein [Tsuneonella litorea]